MADSLGMVMPMSVVWAAINFQGESDQGSLGEGIAS